MRRLVVVLALCLLVAGAVSADAPIGSMTWYAKHVTETGDTHGLDGGYVMYATHNLFGGLGPWQYCWINDKGMCRISLPLPVVCWSGTDRCATLTGQWLYWTIVPPHYGACTTLDTGAVALSGVTWIATQAESVGTIWQGECQP